MMRSTFLVKTAAPLLLALPVALAAPRVWAAGAPVSSATRAQKKTASEHFLAGMKASKAGDPTQALSEFQASYDAVASPNSHLMVARTLATLGRLGQAYDAYEQTVDEANAAAQNEHKYKKTADAAQNERDQLKSRVAFVSVSVNGADPSDQLVVAGRTIDRSDWDKPIAVTPGSVQVELRAPSGRAQTRVIQAAAGATSSVTLPEAAPSAAPAEKPKPEPAAVSSHHNSTRTLAYVAGGVGAAGLVTFAIFGLLDNSKYSDLQNACAHDVCSASRKSDADTGRTYQTVANVGLGVGIVGLATGTVLYFLSSKTERAAASTPRIDVGLRSVLVTGSF
jgi:hypothetical protein